MSNSIIRAVKTVGRRFGVDLIRYRPPTADTPLQDALTSLHRLRDLADQQPGSEELRFIDFCCRHYRLSKSQIFQDLFVQFELGERSGGFFVEFGATNGVNLSNTHLLEKHYGWQGILAEPARVWRADLQRNRSCTLDFRCVWDGDGQQLQFNETPLAELSTIDSFSNGDLHAKTRQQGERYTVNTVSLNSLLREHAAPAQIDYLSVDTEGSELKILSAFDFSRHDIKLVTVEHNYTADREPIHALLRSRGFERKFTAFSLWDDWYVAANR